MQVNKKLIIITLILLSLLMINSASAATDTQTNVKSDVIHKEKVTTHIDKNSSSYNNVAKTNTNINAQKELKKKNIKNGEDDGKISSTKKNNDRLRADEKTFNDLQENITTAADVAKTITLHDDYIQTGTDAITIGNTQKITINGNGHTIDAKGESRIFLVYGELTLENLTLKNGKAQNGGAIYANENSHMSLNNIIFQNNTAPENECNGGAIYAYGADITINNTQFNNNTAFYGGAIGTDSDSNVSISNSNFNNNNATIGGAISAFSAAVNVTYSDFKNNHAQNYTGAIVFANTHDNFVSSCIFVNNTSPNSGSAIYEYLVGSLEINNNIFLNTDSNTITLTNPEKVNLNYNWFGNNANNYDTKPIEGSIDNWLFLNATCNNQIMLLKPADISFELYLYNSSDTGNEVSDYDASKLKTFNLTITTNNGDIQPKIVQLGDIITYTPNSTGEGGITASIGGINYTKIVKVISETSFTSLYENITKSIESGQQVILTHNYTYDPNTDGNFINGIPINTAVQIIGKGITISGNNQARIFHVKSNGNLKLENLTLTNGKAQNGGAIYAERNTYILINNTQFNNNQATTDGGALYTDYSSSTVSVSNSNFNNNNATTGGAIYVRGPVNVTCSEFKNNHAQNEGGAILFFNGEDNFVVSCVFGNNTATNGSAIYEINVANLKINNTIFLNTDNNTIKFNNVNYVKLSYNWFGNTNDNYTTKPNIDTSISISNWLFLNATADPDNIISGTSSEIVFKLYLYNGTDVQDYDNTLLYPVNLTINSVKGEVNSSFAQLGDTIIYTPNSTSEGSITASIGDISYTKIVKVISETSFTALYDNITKSIESGQPVIILTHDYTYNDTTDGDLITGIPINTTVHIIGNGFTISGNNLARIFYVTSTGNLTIENLTLTNGKSQKTSEEYYDGGAIYAEENSYISLNNTIFQNNIAPIGDSGYGGAIYTNAYIIINNTQFNNNTGYYGGALYANSNSTVTISNSNFNNNKASYGGAIFTYQGLNVSINNSTFNNNNATKFGGAIGGSAVNVTYSEFKNNHAQNGDGGAILFNNIHNNSIISSCIFVNNAATNSGNAIHESFDIMNGNLKINNNIFLNTDSNTIALQHPDLLNLDYNWFGNTNDNYRTKPNISANINSWLFLNAAANPDNIIGLGAFSDIVFKLYLYNYTIGEVFEYNNTQLKPVNLTITQTKGEINKEIVQLGDNITYKSMEYGKGSITASIEGIIYTKEIINAKETSFIALYDNITKSIESGQPVIILTHNYTYDDATDDKYITGMPIITTVYIIGNGITISGNNQARIFQVKDGGDLTLENLTLTNGKAQINFDGYAYGGAIYADYSNINLNNIIFQNNTALEYFGSGGAIHAEDTNITINNTQFNNNIGGYGGAIYAKGYTLSISNSNFNNNNATNIGGAIHAYSITLSISNSNFNNNNANKTGGAINAHSTVNVTYSEFKNNHAQENGGAIQFDYDPDNFVSSCIFMNNTATTNGSAIYENIFEKGTLKINNNIFLNADSNTITLEHPDWVNCDYNWFGNTADNYATKPNIGANINSWLFLNGTPDSVQFGSVSNITFELYVYNSSNSKVSEYDNSQLKPVNLTITPNQNIEKTTALIGEKIPYTANTSGSDSVTAGIGDISYTINLKIKIPTNITVNTKPITLNVTDTAQINAKLDPSEAGTLMYASNDTSVAIVDEYGRVTAISKGVALITVYFNGEGNYDAAENKTLLVTVNPKELTTQITDLTIPNDLFEGKTSIINGTLTANGNKLANQKITITITNTNGYKGTFTGNTDANGKFSIKIKPDVSGPVTILTIYNGNTTNKYDYKPTSNSTNRNVQKVVYNIKLDTLQTSYDYNTKVNITGQITSNYQPLDVKNVNITINGVIKTVALNSTGGFKYVSPYTTNGLYKVLINCSETTKNTQYFIKYPTKFTITKIPNTTTNKAITITVKESNGFTGTVNVKIGNKEYKVQLTNGKGNKKIKITKPGKYNVKINYKGNEKYTKTSATSNKFTIKYLTKFIIRKIPNTTTNKVFTIRVKGSNRFTGKVNVKIGKKVYKVQLKNGKGNKKIKITRPGKYIAKINYKGNKKYTKTSAKSNKFTIKYPTKFTINKIPNIKTGSQIKLTIKEKNKYTGPVKVTIGSKKYTIKLKKGIGKKTITPKLTPGKYTAKIQFKGNKKYRPAKAASNKFQITKNNYY